VRIVLDTSALVSGFLWNGTPRRLIEAALAHQLELFTTQTLLAEFERVSARAKFASRMAAQQLTPALLVQRYRTIAQTVIPADIGPAVIADPDDDHVLACALAARAALVVSRDPHLLNLKHFHTIPILDPAAALAFIERNSTSR
jgi:putative PIN family toxin of toxin-antitoxin system